MFGLGTQELLVFGVIAVLLFGKRLPEVAKSIGSSYREFRRGLTDLQRQMDVSRYLEDDKPGWSRSKVEVDADYGREPAVPKFEPPAMPESPSSDNFSNSKQSPSDSAESRVSL